MAVSVSIDINASPRRVAAIMIDVERWHEWTASITSVTLLDGRPLVVGSRALVKQPRLPAARWKVTGLDDARGFTWESRGPGYVVTGHHYAEPAPGGARATLSLAYSGLLGGIIARLTRDITLRYVQMEAQGLRQRSEKLEAHS